MSYQVLARKWRPRNFSQVVGQHHVVRALSNALDSDRLHHAYLFTGTRGVGKTTLARVLAKCFNCEQGVSSKPCGECSSCQELDEGRFIDLLEVDAASRAKVDETRELMDNVPFAPARGRFKVYLIDEVHMFSAHSFNALLKTLEEPPPHVKFLLATTDPQKLPVTVLSRCLQFNLKRVSVDDIAGQIERILDDEKIEVESDATRLLARAADGSLRDALSLLDQAIAYGDGQVHTETVREMLGTLDQDRVLDMIRSLASTDVVSLMAGVAEMAEQVVDFALVLDDMLSMFQAIAMTQLVPGYAHPIPEAQAQLGELAALLSREDVQLYYQIGLLGGRDLPLAPDPRAGFEMVLLRMLAFRPPGAADVSPGPATSVPGTIKPTIVNESPKKPVRKPIQETAQEPAQVAVQAAVQEAVEVPVSPTEAAPKGDGILSSANWSEVVGHLAVSGLTRELANNSIFAGAEDTTVELLLNPGFAYLRTPIAVAELENALRVYRGGQAELNVVLDNHDAETPAARDIKVAKERREAAIQAIENDPNVQSLRDTFGAVIDRNSIEPRDG